MHRLQRLLGIVILALLCNYSVVAAAPGIVLGDSIGVGLAAAGGLKGLAQNSVTIGSGDIARQIAAVPAGAVAFISLGTNDAVGSIKGVEARIDRTLAAIEAAGLTAVWVGPVCVIQPWNETVTQLDAVLRRKLAGRVPYVSLAGEAYCDTGIRGHDGVHFTFAGYRRLWARARAAAGQDIESSAASVPKPGANKRKKPRRKHTHGHKVEMVAPVAFARAKTHSPFHRVSADMKAWRLLAVRGNLFLHRT